MRVVATTRAAWRATVLMMLIAGLSSSCKSKHESAGKPAPKNVAGLAAIPAEVTAVVAFDVKAMRTSWLVRRATAQMLRRDPGLEERIAQLIGECKFDPAADLDGLIIGLGSGDAAAKQAGTAPDPGLAEAVMVVTGRFVEAELASCIGQSVATDGGTLTVEPTAEGRSFYNVTGRRGSADAVWFTVAGPRTLVVATSSGWLRRAVGEGEKLEDSTAMKALLAKVDRKAGVWAAARVDPKIGSGLVELTEITAPPAAIFVESDFRAGLRFMLGAEMSSEDDSKSLVSLIKSQKALGVLAAQRYGLGPLLQKLRVDSEGKTVYLRMSVTEDEIRSVLSKLDLPAGSTRDPVEN